MFTPRWAGGGGEVAERSRALPSVLRVVTRGLVGSTLVLLGGLVISTVPWSSWVVEIDAVRWLRVTEAGRMAGLVVVLVGLGMLAAAWLRTCRLAARAGTDEQADVIARVRASVVVWSLPLLVAPPLFSRDGWSYAAQGVQTHLGISPYEHGPGVLTGTGYLPAPIVQGVDPRWMETAAPYGPVPLIAGDLSAALTTEPWPLVVAHRLVALVGLVLLAWAVPRLARWCGADPGLSSAVLLGSPLVLANGVGGLHNDLLLAGLAAAALVLAHERSWVAGAIVGGLAAGVKLPGAVVCVAVVLVTLPAAADLAARFRHTARVAAVAVAALVLPGVVWGLGVGWVDALGVPGTVRTPLSLPTVVGGTLDGLAGLVGLGTEPATFLDAVRLLAQAGLVAVLVWVCLTRPTGSPASAVRVAGLAFGATIALSPVVHLWYLLWVVPFLAAQRLSRAGVTALVALLLVGGLVAPLDSSLHGAYLMIVVGSMVVGAVALVLLVTPAARSRLAEVTAQARPVR